MQPLILRVSTATLDREWVPGCTGSPCPSGWSVPPKVGAQDHKGARKSEGGGARAIVTSLGAEACLCPEQLLAGEAVPGPGPVWPLNIWCESKAFSSQERNAAEWDLGTGLAGQTLP